MKKNTKYLIISLIIFLCIILLILIFLIIKKVKKDSNFGIYDNTTDLNSINLIDIDSIGSQDSERPFDNIKEVIEGENNENVNQTNRTDQDFKTINESINSIKISIANVTTETQDYIKNKDEFLYKIKKFMYENNLLDADTMTLTNSNIQNNQLIMLFVMNNQRKTKLKIVYNITDNSTEVSKQ